MYYTLQVSRAVAALLVVFFHAGEILAKEKYFGSTAQYLDDLFWFGGRAGVAYFFVLSGFIISYVHWKDLGQPDKLLGYLKRRVIRIYPTYVSIFTAVYLVGMMVPSIAEALPRDPWLLCKSLLLVPQDKHVVGGVGAPVLIVAWTLQYEIVFYLVFALGVLNVRWMVLIFLVYGLLLTSWIFGWKYEFPLDFLSSPLILLFLMGVVTAKMVRWVPRMAHAKYTVVGLLVLFICVATVASMNKGEDMKSPFDILYGLVSAGLIFSLIRFESDIPGLEKWRMGAVLGDSSYALYLIHFPLMSVLCKLVVLVLPINVWGAMGAFFSIVCLSVVAALVVHVCLEGPTIKYMMRQYVGAAALAAK